jgi:pyruvate,water dikinase
MVSATNGLPGDRERSDRYVLDLAEIGRTDTVLAGGKGANLGELARIDAVRVPAGFCVTTDAFRRAMAEAPSVERLLHALSRLEPDDHDAIRALGTEIRRAIGAPVMPGDIAAAIAKALARHGEQAAYAVRSSATAEDLPTKSFAGQHDTYLNISGPAAVVRHVGRCWASLFTERAVNYRLRNGIDPREVAMSVVVQQMVFPTASGVLFTADPVSGDRRTISIEAGFGLGEALVSGLVNADVYTLRDDAIVARTIATKQVAVDALPTGGTQQRAIESSRQQQAALTDAEATRLAALGRRIEAHFGEPQDIEWCLVDGDFHIVQSRPITTLFPIPFAADAGNHVYVSVGHQQMMTDAIRPLGISMWQLTTATTMHEAGARLFVDVTRMLATPAGRAGNLAMLSRSDPLIGDALRTILDRGDFIRPVPDPDSDSAPRKPAPAPLETDPAIVAELIAHSRASNAKLKREIETKSGAALFDFMRTDMRDLRGVLFDPRNLQAIMASVEATWWLNDRLEEWLGEKNAADALAQSVPDNVTSEMGLDLMRVADAIRPHPAVVAFLREVDGDDFLDELPALEGGAEAKAAIEGWLDRYGMRCVGEIDITRPRWSERPASLMPLILGNVRNFERGAGERRFAQGLEAARNREAGLLARLRALPDGDLKAGEAKAKIERLRTFAGYREYPKYVLVERYFAYKRALMREAGRLARSGVLPDVEDAFFLTFDEFHEAVRTNEVDRDLIRARRDAFETHRGRVPPRVLTSDGEMLNGAYRREGMPAGALIGLAVSAGTVEGRARIVLDPANASIEPGDILVTTFTDPSWTPLFVAIRALVTEVGGLMTHGAVIAREYGLPAVVGVARATRLIREGQRIRVHGTEGYIELLD